MAFLLVTFSWRFCGPHLLGKTVFGLFRGYFVAFLIFRVHAKGVVLCERACFCPSKHLLSAFYDPPLLKTLLRTPVSTETLTRRLLGTLLRRTCLKNLLRTLLRSVLLHDPLGVHPNFGQILRVLALESVLIYILFPPAVRGLGDL